MLTSKSSWRCFSTSSGATVCRISAIQAGVAIALGERRLRNTWYISCSAFRPYLNPFCVCQHRLLHKGSRTAQVQSMWLLREAMASNVCLQWERLAR